MPSNYLTPDPIQGTVDLDDKFITDSFLVDQFVGGTLFACGYNFHGQLGNGTTTKYSSPIQIGSLTNWSKIACGFYHKAIIKTDGTLWTCGYNYVGCLGNGTTIKYSSPIQIGSLTNWKQVACGDHTLAAIKTDGTLWSCGYNNWGQLGNGTVNVYYSSPVQIGSLTNWKQVSCGAWAMSAIKTDGTLWGWGQNNNSNLGYGNTISYSSPVQIGSLTTWKQVACGYFHGTAIKTDGTLWAWGFNDHGQLGNGTTIKYSSPIQVGTSTNWKQVAANYGQTLAIKTDGTLWTCGYNIFGQLGNGTGGSTIKYSSPIQIGSLTNWKQVSAGFQYTAAAIKTDGTLWAWGRNDQGQLGNGTITDYSSPIQVGSLTNWKQVSLGWTHMAAITYKDLG